MTDHPYPQYAGDDVPMRPADRLMTLGGLMTPQQIIDMFTIEEIREAQHRLLRWLDLHPGDHNPNESVGNINAATRILEGNA